MTAELWKARVAGQFEALDWVITNIDAERFGRRPQVDKWSAHEHLAHVACSQQRFLERLRAILTTDRPAFRRYRAEHDPEWPQWQGLSRQRLLERLKTLEEELVTMIGSLSDAQLSRVGLHSTFGAMNVAQWLEFFLLHQAHHVYVAMTLAWRGRPDQTSEE
jgi:uncharacterized damage-inducible protein DinB